MKAIRLSFFQMTAAMRRDMMLFAACLAPILAGFFFRFGIPFLESALTDYFQTPAILSPYYKLTDVFFMMLSPTMFCFVSAMVSLEEADEKTAAYLFITPLGKTGYLAARLGIPAAAAFLVTLILFPVFKLTFFSPIAILLFTACGTLQGLIVALFVLALSSNRLEGMAVTKLSTLTVFGALIPFFIKDNVQFALFPLPSFWMGKAACENVLLYMFPAFALSDLWIGFLLRWYLRKMQV
ncbi:MAG TPA: ABC transporter permease [Lachnospiraceae bacterium]|nr:ABC transporter permease [Lachnospiraceae bacterium]